VTSFLVIKSRRPLGIDKAQRALGESVTVEGVTVKVIASDASGDTVEISK
jgi:hypothetical protein